MSAITPIVGYTLDLTPGTIMTLTLDDKDYQRANLLMVSLVLMEDTKKEFGLGIALTNGGPGKAPNPVTPVRATGTTADNTNRGSMRFFSDTPAFFTLRGQEFKFLLDPASLEHIALAASLVLAQDIPLTATPRNTFRIRG